MRIRNEDAASDRLASIFRALPAGVIVMRGPEHRIEFANELYRQIVGGRDLVGRTVREAFPEVEGQGFFELLDGVYATGEPYYGTEVRILLDRSGDGVLDEAFVNFVYLARCDEQGRIEGVLAHAVEVTELVQARQRAEALARELEDERARLAIVLDQMPAGVVIAEIPSGRLVNANREWRDFFGVPVDSIEDVDSYSTFVGLRPDGSEYAAEEYPLARSVRSGEVVVGEEIEFRRADGTRRWIEINSAPILDRDGKAVTGVAAFFDVTVRRRAEALLAAHQAVLESVAEGAPLGRTLDLLVRMIERRAEGRILASILLLEDGRLHHGAAPSLPDEYNAAIDGVEIGPAAGSCGTAAYRNDRVVVADIEHDPLWVDYAHLALPHGLRACWSTPIRGGSGDVLGTFALYYSEPGEPPEEHEQLVRIATRTAAVAIERARLERERAGLLEREQRARAEAEARAEAAVALEYVADGVCLLDLDGVVRLWNPAAERLLGLGAGEVLGRRLVDLVPGWRIVLGRGERATGEPVPIEHRGREVWLAVSSVSFAGGTVYAFRDVSDEHRLEELRADMIATVSHELRTPLAAVYGAAKTLQRADLGSEDGRRLVEMIGDEGERLRALIDEILLASQLDGPGRLELAIVRLDLRRCVERVAASAQGRVDVVLPDEPVFAVADDQRVRQVLVNLVDNALKYGRPPVTVAVERAGTSARVAVTDCGPGIPPHQRDRIFEKFFRLDPNLRGGVGGTGLGLYIARELVLRMGGRIAVEPAPGGGSTFAVELPAD